MIRVLIADDHKMFLQGLKALLTKVDNVEIIADAVNGKQAIKLIKHHEPDIAILDISMPQMDGVAVLNECIKSKLKTKVILLTLHKDSTIASHAVKAGAMGYILKDNAFEELLYALETVFTGTKFISPSVTEAILNLQSEQKDKVSDLTERETEVLKYIALGFTNKKIAEKLFISVKTVETHRSRILKKLDLHRVADLVRYAVKEKLISE